MMSDALMIFKEGDYWVNYQDGVKTVFAEIGAIRQSPEPQTEPEINVVYDTPRHNNSVVYSETVNERNRVKPIHHNIFEQKENDNGRSY